MPVATKTVQEKYEKLVGILDGVIEDFRVLINDLNFSGELTVAGEKAFHDVDRAHTIIQAATQFMPDSLPVKLHK